MQLYKRQIQQKYVGNLNTDIYISNPNNGCVCATALCIVLHILTRVLHSVNIRNMGSLRGPRSSDKVTAAMFAKRSNVIAEGSNKVTTGILYR